MTNFTTDKIEFHEDVRMEVAQDILNYIGKFSFSLLFRVVPVLGDKHVL